MIQVPGKPLVERVFITWAGTPTPCLKVVGTQATVLVTESGQVAYQGQEFAGPPTYLAWEDCHAAMVKTYESRLIEDVDARVREETEMNNANCRYWLDSLAALKELHDKGIVGA